MTHAPSRRRTAARPPSSGESLRLARRRVRAWPILAAALAGGCAGALFEPLRPGSLAEGAVVLPIPHVPQERERGCGWSVASMLSQYYGRPITDGERERLLGGHGSAGGVSGRALADLLWRNGFDAEVFRGRLLDDRGPTGLSYHLKRKRPVVVMLSLDGSRRHYVVVSGVDVRRGLVAIVDPGKGHLVLSIRTFLRMWGRANFFALLAVPARLRGREEGNPEPG